MEFLYSPFLWALGTLAIPIIIHLFFFRRFKKVYFTNVRFLKEVKEETTNRQKLRNLLVLLMRCLAIAALVLAFAQPFIPKGDTVKNGEKSVSLFIDNSFSMNALSKDAPLLEIAKKRAREIVTAYAPDDRFQILTNDFEGRDQRLVSKEDALNRIEEIRTSPASKDLSKALTRQQQCLATGKSDLRTAFLITDFQKNISDLKNFTDTLLEVNLVPIKAVQEKNISIDSAWFESPVQILRRPSVLMVKISNRSSEDAEEIRLSLRHDKQTKPVTSFSIPAKGTITDSVPISILHTGWHEAKLSITDFPVQFDDDYYLNFFVPDQINVLSINGIQENKYIASALASAAFFKLDNVSITGLDYSKLPDYQLVILQEPTTISSGLAQELKSFAQQGGNIVLFPSQQADLGSYNSFLQNFEAGTIGAYEKTPRQGSQVNTDEYLFKDVFQNKSANLRLPNTQGNFKLAANRGEQIISYRDGSAYLAKYNTGLGALYVCASPLDERENDLVRNGEVFVPMLFKMAVAGAKTQRIANTIGKDEVLEANHLLTTGGESVYKMRGGAEKDGQESFGSEFIPEQRIIGKKALLTPGSQINEAGWYKLSLKGDSTLGEYSFNFDRKESQLDYLDNEGLRAAAPAFMKIIDATAEANFAQVVGERNQGIVLWRWCLIFALLFLALEVLFLRLWKV